MNNQTFLLLILGMLIATYLPRLLPFYAIKKERIPKWFFRILSYIPYAMLGAMIIPGFMSGVEGQPLISLMAFLSGVLICFKFGGTILPILTAIIVATLMQVFVG
jgi:branched-subunit amino acid transport protein